MIDDVEKRAMALPEPARPPLYHERALRVHELYELLHLEARDDISFAQLLTVRKGTKLVARTVPFLGKVSTTRLFNWVPQLSYASHTTACDHLATTKDCCKHLSCMEVTATAIKTSF